MTKATTARRDFEARLKALVDKFERHREDYLRSDYSEAQVRVDFIDPFFEALGWDVHDHAALGPQDRQVVVEKGETSGNPDYNFRHQGRTVFYVEAKAPHVPLERTDVVMQAKSYAWNSRDVFLAAITDFEEFRLYDATPKPDPRHPDVGLIFACRYDEYLQPKALDDLWLLSLESVAGGSIDRLLKRSTVLARQKIPVDQAFLDDLTEWREQLAKAVYKHELGISVGDLNSVVQVFLDRLIFIRLAEDRGILPPRGLEDIAREWEHSGKRRSIRDALNDLFREVNLRLNGEIFKPHQAEKIDWDPCAELVAKIIAGLYPPSPYRFDVIGVELLGSIYERYLGKTIRVTPTRAMVEDKPEVRKAGGVYYTPKYIVDYIVEQTVGKLIQGKTPKQTLKLRVLDPACGSGSFLLAAYQRLIDHHERWYADRARRKRARLAQPGLLAEGEGGEFRLSLAQKAEIVRSCIYGVDIDPQAVEITMMSLYIKMLEGEKGAIAGRGVLPPLRDNIKCGNSLISHDIARQPDLFGELSPADLDRINPFDWQSKSEGFGQIMAEGGFDVVIGNPPYIRIQVMKEWAPFEVELYKKHYRAAGSGNYDIYVVFVEKGLGLLNNIGRLGFILPHKFFNAKYGAPLRSLISEGKHLAHVVHFGDQQVFAGATTYTCLLFLDKAGSEACDFVKVNDLEAWRAKGKAEGGLIASSVVSQEDWSFAVGNEALVRARLQEIPVKLGDIASRLAQGIRTSANEVYVLDLVSAGGSNLVARSEQLDREVRLETALTARFLQGREIKRYQLLPSGKLVIIPYTIVGGHPVLIPESELRRSYPRVMEYLSSNKPVLQGRERGRMKGPNWHGYVYPKNLDVMRAAKIIVPDIANHACFALDRSGEYTFASGYGITLRGDTREALEYVLGLLNSSLLNFYLRQVSTPMQNGFFRYFTQFIERLPIRTINFSDSADRKRYDTTVSLVERMLELHKQKQVAAGDAARARIEREIHVTDEKIDALVYELYGLTDEEIRIVEESA